jgi:uncharacterized protein with HEPN domain
MRPDRLRLLDALDQIELIRTFSARGQEAFVNDVLLQSALLHRLTLLGEACRALSPELRDAHPEVPWAQIIAFRNILIHQYFGIDLDLVWTIIADHMAPLATSLDAILKTMPP